MARAFTIKVTGAKKVLRRLGVLDRHTPKELGRAMVRVSEEVIGDAKEMTPVDTGALRGSGHVQMPEETMFGMSVKMGFGGVAGAGENTEDVGYALPVHERMDVHHKVGGPKYLERAIQKHMPSMVSKFRRQLDAAIRARFGLIN